jgi:hypothetical protein
VRGVSQYRLAEILEWRGDVPVLGCLGYDLRTWFFYCPECKTFHYHKSVVGIQKAKCTKGRFISTGYYLKEI